MCIPVRGNRGLGQEGVGENRVAYLSVFIYLYKERTVIGRGRGTFSGVDSRCVIPVLATPGACVGV